MAEPRGRSRIRNLRRALVGLAVAAVAGAGGCSMVTPFGAIYTSPTDGGASYIAGRATQVFATSDGFIEEARQALEDIHVAGVAQRYESGTIVLEGRAPNGKAALVRLQPENEGRRMRVFVRFGAFGDEALSIGYLDALRARVRGEAGELTEVPPPRTALPPRLKPSSAEEPPGTIFQRRLEGGIRSDQPYQL